MKPVIIKSLLFSAISITLMYSIRVFFKTDAYLADVGGLSAFATVFGTLYGIMAAFVVFEVWSQFNKTTSLVENEAHGLEKLFRLILYFRDDNLTAQMEKAIKKYGQVIIKSQFAHLSKGTRSKESSQTFREISKIIKDIKFNDDHDQIIFQQVVNHYDNLSETRTERINQCLTRLPHLLKFFIYSASFFALFIFIIMPFNNMLYGFVATGFLAFVVAMAIQLIEDLDNPFVGFWNITPEPFERALEHIERDYK